MVPYQTAYMALSTGESSYRDKKVNEAVSRLFASKMPSAVYPFAMKVLYEYANGSLATKNTVNLLYFVESFLVRRAILGFEPTGLHALFKGVWNELRDRPSVKALKAEILKRPTIQYPENEQISEALKTRSLAKARICAYILLELDRTFAGDTPGDKISIEHVLPQSYDADSDWAASFSSEQHKVLKDTLANVIPLSIPLNTSLQASEYAVKRKRYEEESMFVTARLFAKKWKRWTPSKMEQRRNELFEYIVDRWPE